MAEDVVIKVRINDDGTREVFDQMGNRIKSVAADAEASATRMSSSFSRIQASIVSANQALELAGRAYRGFRSIVDAPISAAAEFEALQTRLVGLTGSVTAAEQAFSRMTDLAATTPFSVKGIVEAGVTLEAFGASSERSLKSVTDLAAFMGTDVVEAAAAYGRAFAGGAGAADILRERGVLAMVKMREGIDDLSKLSLPQFREALERAMIDPAGRIAGSTDRLTKTWVGAMSNLSDSVDVFQASLGETVTKSRLVNQVIGAMSDEFLRLAGGIDSANQSYTIMDDLLSIVFRGSIDVSKVMAAIIPEMRGMFDELDRLDKAFERSDAFARRASDIGSLSGVTMELANAQAELARNEELLSRATGEFSTSPQHQDAMRERVQHGREWVQVLEDELTVRKALAAEKPQSAPSGGVGRASYSEMESPFSFLPDSRSDVAIPGLGFVSSADAFRLEAAGMIDLFEESGKEAGERAKVAVQEGFRGVNVNLGDEFRSSLRRAIDFDNPSNFGDAFEGIGKRMASEVIGGLIEAQLYKSGTFDVAMGENFTVTLPGFLRDGMGSMTSIWSSGLGGMGQMVTDFARGALDAFSSIGSSLTGLFRSTPGLEEVVVGQGSVLSPTAPHLGPGGFPLLSFEQPAPQVPLAGPDQGATAGLFGITPEKALNAGVGALVSVAGAAIIRNIDKVFGSGPSISDIVRDRTEEVFRNGSVPLGGGGFNFFDVSGTEFPIDISQERAIEAQTGVDVPRGGFPARRFPGAQEPFRDSGITVDLRDLNSPLAGRGLLPGTLAFGNLEFADLDPVATAQASITASNAILSFAHNIDAATGAAKDIFDALGLDAAGAVEKLAHNFNSGDIDFENFLASVEDVELVLGDQLPRGFDLLTAATASLEDSFLGLRFNSEQFADALDFVESSVKAFDSSFRNAIGSDNPLDSLLQSSGEYIVDKAVDLYLQGSGSQLAQEIRVLEDSIASDVANGRPIDPLERAELAGLRTRQLQDANGIVAGITGVEEYFGLNPDGSISANRSPDFGSMADQLFSDARGLGVQAVQPTARVDFLRNRLRESQSLLAAASTPEEREEALQRIREDANALAQAGSSRFAEGSAAREAVISEAIEALNMAGEQADSFTALSSSVDGLTTAVNANTESNYALAESNNNLADSNNRTAAGGFQFDYGGGGPRQQFLSANRPDDAPRRRGSIWR